MFFFFNNRDEIREQIVSLKKEYKKDQLSKIETEVEEKKEEINKDTANELMQTYISKQEEYASLKKKIPNKGTAREQHTLELLARFKNKLENIKEKENPSDEAAAGGSEPMKKITSVRPITSDNEDDIEGDSWMSHTLRFEEKAPILAKDASTKKDDWYDAFDPRNPLNKRKRGEGGRRN